MSTYCSVSLQTQNKADIDSGKKDRRSGKNSKSGQATDFDDESLMCVSKRTQAASGKNPKWSESFAFQLGQMYDSESEDIDSFLLEIGIWSSNYVMSDKCIGRAFLKFDNSKETGSITQWLKLRNDQQVETGEVFVSISKDKIAKSQLKMGHSIIPSGEKQQEQYYTHLVQNTEECMALGGDKDDQLLAGHDGEDVNPEANVGDDEIQEVHQLQRPEPEEVPYEEDDDDEGLQSPVDDVQNDLINMQKQEILRQRQAQIQMISNLHQREPDDLDEDSNDGELDEHLQAVGKNEPH